MVSVSDTRLVGCDEIPVAEVGHPVEDYDISRIKRDKDRFGNVVLGLFFTDDGSEYAWGSRRNDCYVETDDGSRRPHWNIYESGTDITVEDWENIPEDDLPPVGADTYLASLVRERLHDDRGLEIESLESGRWVTMYDSHEWGQFHVQVEFEGSDA